VFGKRDPVCGARVRRKDYSLEYEGKIYYFDSLACKTTFQENPHRFIKGGDKEGGFFGKLASHAEEVPRSCHEIKR